jgi:hypothetical protein
MTRRPYHRAVDEGPEVDERTLGAERRWVEGVAAASVERADALKRADAALDRARSLNARMHERAIAELDEALARNRAEATAAHAVATAQAEARFAELNAGVDGRERGLAAKARKEAMALEERYESDYTERLTFAEGLLDDQTEEFTRVRNRKCRSYEAMREKVAATVLEAESVVRGYRQRPLKVREDASAPGEESALESGWSDLGRRLEALRRCRTASVFRGPILAVPGIAMPALGAIAGAVLANPLAVQPTSRAAAMGAGAGLALFVACTVALWLVARREVRLLHRGFTSKAGQILGGCARAADLAKADHAVRVAAARAQCEAEIESAKSAYGPKAAEIAAKLDAHLKEVARLAGNDRGKVLKLRFKELEAADRARDELLAAAESRCDRARAEEVARHAAVASDSAAAHAAARAAAVAAWHAAQASFVRSMRALEAADAVVRQAWTEARWAAWKPPTDAPGAVAPGILRLSLASLPGAVPPEPELAWSGIDPSATIEVPAFVGGDGHFSARIEAPPEHRAEALGLATNLLARILESFPPGKARFTFIDPVGLGQSFAGFMHLADEMDALVNERAWTDPRHIEQRLADVTEHMETVIQKYLRNEYQSLAEYNAQAGEIAEAYRFVVIADFPANITEASAKRLTSILRNGPRCGVNVILLSDLRQPLPAGLEADDLRACTALLRREPGEAGAWRVDAGGLAAAEFVPDRAPDDALLQRVTRDVGRAAREGNRVEVPFSAVAPAPEERWTLSSAASFRVALGRSGANRLQHLLLGEGTRQHALVAGKTGSGKSSLLNALIVNTALWYSPDEVELWLIDFKKGVEFKAYAAGGLPHARAVAVESDREFGLSVLQGLDAELARRGEMFRAENVQNVTDWRAAPGRARMPRVLLVIDEFQELFTEDDKVAQESSLLLDRLVRQGRAFGMHVVLGSQTLGGAYGIARATMGQMGVRIALQCNETDSQLILSDDNTAARLLSRPGEAIYNDAGGLVEGNNPFQVVWIGDAERDATIRQVKEFAEAHPSQPRPPAIVFEGNQPADPAANGLLSAALAEGPTAASALAPRLWLGDAVSIKDPTSVRLARRTGANLAIVGQRDESAAALLAMAMVSIAAQVPVDGARLVVLDGTTPDDRLHGTLARVAGALPTAAAFPSLRDAGDAVVELAREVARRSEEGAADRPGAFLVVNGLHRYRALRRDESDYGFGSGGDALTPDKALAAILREGPAVGVHCVLWADTTANLQRSVDRTSMRDIDSKVLFQMGANDSSSLIDGPAASRLGFHRALLADEESGALEKFRPYSLPDAAFLARVTAAIGRRPAGARP